MSKKESNPPPPVGVRPLPPPAPINSPLQWHWEARADGCIIRTCSDCGKEVWVFEEGEICSGCKKTSDDQENDQEQNDISRKESAPPTVLYGWVWERVLTDYTSGIAVAFAPNESGAWDALKRVDRLAWRNIREHPEDRDDPRTPEELPHRVRPRRIEAPEAFIVWGGC